MQNKSDILNLVKTIAGDVTDNDTLAIYYDEALEMLGKSPNPPLVELELFAITSGTATYTIDSSGVRLLYIYVDTNEMRKTTTLEAEAYSNTWRTTSGTPVVWAEDEENARTFRLIPEPDTTSDDLIPTNAQPLGQDFPDNYGAQLYANKRDFDINDVLAFPLALYILQQEFARPSDHTDVALSDACRDFTTLFKTLVGVL